jgi:hypothetical protein
VLGKQQKDSFLAAAGPRAAKRSAMRDLEEQQLSFPPFALQKKPEPPFVVIGRGAA